MKGSENLLREKEREMRPRRTGMLGALSIIPVMGCLVLGTVAVPGRYGTGLFPRRSEREHGEIWHW